MSSFGFDKYVDYMDTLDNLKDYEFTRELLMSYLTCEDILDNDYTLAQAEEEMLGGSRERRPLKAVDKLLKIFHQKAGEGKIPKEAFDELVGELNEILAGDYSDETKIARLRRRLATFGIENKVDSYLFEEIYDTFQEKCTAIESYDKSDERKRGK